VKSEIEAKFLSVNHDEIRQKLAELGGVCEQPMRHMRRVTIETPELIEKDAFVRVRDEGHRVTMTYKQFDSFAIDGAKEIEVVVSNFEDMVALLAAAGLPQGSFQESRRETWKLDNVEVVLDEWPWLKPYIEIEGESEESVCEAAERLGFDWEDAVFGDVMAAYRAEYPHLTEKDSVARIPQVRFDDPLPKLLQVSTE
jgi:adenylate cyclase, class 2